MPSNRLAFFCRMAVTSGKPAPVCGSVVEAARLPMVNGALVVLPLRVMVRPSTQRGASIRKFGMASRIGVIMRCLPLPCTMATADDALVIAV